METYELSSKEFRIILLNNLSELWKYTAWHLNKIRKTIHEQN